MASRDYTIVYKVNDTQAVAAVAAFKAQLIDLELVVDRIKPKIQGIATGASAPLGAMGRSASALTGQFAKLEAGAIAAQSAIQGMGGSLPQTSVHINTAGSSVAAFGAKMLALREGVQVIKFIGDESVKLSDYWKSLATEAGAFREELRELANIKGKTGPDAEIYADVLSLSLETGMVPEKAKEFAQAYENIGPTVRDKGHFAPDPKAAGVTPEMLEKDVLIEAGKTARRLGIDEKTAGEAIGMAGLFHSFTSTEQAMNVFGGAAWGLSKGKVEYKAGFKALAKGAAKLADDDDAAQAGAARGTLGYDEAAVWLGAMSLVTGTADQAHMRMVQMSRVVNKIDPTAQAALKAAGITPDMDDARKAIQLGKFMKTVADPRKFLLENKLATQAESDTVMASMKVNDVLEERLNEMNKGGFGKQLMDENAQNMRTDRAAGAAKAATLKKITDLTQGQAVEQYKTAQEFAETRLRSFSPGYKTVAQATANTFASLYTKMTSGVSGEDFQKEFDTKYGAMSVLKQAGKSVGIDVSKQFPGVESFDYETRARAFGQAARVIEAKGGDPYGREALEVKARQGIGEVRRGDADADAAVKAAAGGAANPGAAGPAIGQNRKAPAGAGVGPGPVAYAPFDFEAYSGPLRV